MKLSALHDKRLGAAVVFVSATLVLAVQLITPSPVMVSVGENGTQTTQLGQYFTYTDVGIISIAAGCLGASGTYLLLSDHTAAGTLTESASQQGSTAGDEAWQPDQDRPDAVGDGDGTTRAQREDADQQQEWAETLDRLRNNEETVYALVVDAGGELPQRDIVEDTELSKASVSRTLDTLESKGLVERKRRGMGNVVVLQ